MRNGKIRLGYSCLAAIFLSLLSGCGSAEFSDEAIGESKDELYWDVSRGASVAHWPKSTNHFGSGLGADIFVCFTTTDAVAGSAEDTARAAFAGKMRTWVENTWGRVADINFHGWERCPSNTNGWLVIAVNNGGATNSLIGYQGAGSPTKINMNRADSRQPVSAIHEVGHALGFHHEFKRSDFPTAPSDAVCSNNSQCTNGNYGPVCVKPAGSSTGFCRDPNGGVGITPADRDSVMAATYLLGAATDADTDGVAEPLGSLSPWDVIGVQQKYGPKHTGSIVGLGGRCANISGSLDPIGQPLIGWPCYNQDNDTFIPFVNQTSPPRKTIPARTGSRCLNVQGGVVSPSNGTPVASWTCIDSATNEQFDFTNMQLRAMGNMCLSAASTSAGALLTLQRCGGTSSSRERWDIVGSQIKLTANTSLCASVPAGASALGTRVVLRSCASDSGQTVVLDNGKVKVGTRCWNVLGGTTAIGSEVGLWDGCGGEYPNERFYATGTIKSLGQCLDMFQGTSFNGVSLGVYPCVANAPNEQWDFHW
jgi:hypothetical protein